MPDRNAPPHSRRYGTLTFRGVTSASRRGTVPILPGAARARRGRVAGRTGPGVEQPTGFRSSPEKEGPALAVDDQRPRGLR